VFASVVGSGSVCPVAVVAERFVPKMERIEPGEIIAERPSPPTVCNPTLLAGR
jgi:hypothetical protein